MCGVKWWKNPQRGTISTQVGRVSCATRARIEAPHSPLRNRMECAQSPCESSANACEHARRGSSDWFVAWNRRRDGCADGKRACCAQNAHGRSRSANFRSGGLQLQLPQPSEGPFNSRIRNIKAGSSGRVCGRPMKKPVIFPVSKGPSASPCNCTLHTCLSSALPPASHPQRAAK